MDAMLILGYAVGSHHRSIGGGSNQLCLPEEPQSAPCLVTLRPLRKIFLAAPPSPPPFLFP